MQVLLLQDVYLYLTWLIRGAPAKEQVKLAQGGGEILFAQHSLSRSCEQSSVFQLSFTK